MGSSAESCMYTMHLHSMLCLLCVLYITWQHWAYLATCYAGGCIHVMLLHSMLSLSCVLYTPRLHQSSLVTCPQEAACMLCSYIACFASCALRFNNKKPSVVSFLQEAACTPCNLQSMLVLKQFVPCLWALQLQLSGNLSDNLSTSCPQLY